MTNILDYSNIKAKDYFLKSECYSNIDLPEYFNFENILQTSKNILLNKSITDFFSSEPTKRPQRYDDVNYKIIANKDGLYAWRPFQLIHPFLYTDLVNEITKKEHWAEILTRFKLFQKNEKIRCMSIPVVATNPHKTQKGEQILEWWREVEQKSLEKALDFSHLFVTDITDCYGCIYTHSIAWAIHDKETIKKLSNYGKPSLIGNIIDTRLNWMSYNQTNGIPQGSVLMDFIAEIVLGYADLKLSECLSNEEIEDYFIIRYRDDYRIFVNNPYIGDIIIKHLTEVLIDLGLKLNPSKTFSTNKIIKGALKNDKFNLITSFLGERYLNNQEASEIMDDAQNQLLQIYDFADKHPNSGQLKRILQSFHSRLDLTKFKGNATVLISIITDLAFNNPSTYHFCAAIISKILEVIPDDSKKIQLIEKISKKMKKMPNTGFMDIWLQRISYKIDPNIEYSDQLCKVLQKRESPLWNSEWLNPSTKNTIEKISLINQSIIDAMAPVITKEEVDLFNQDYPIDAL